MKDKQIKIKFFTIADYVEEQQWLSAQQLKSWQLVKAILPCFFVFERCEPQQMIYQIEYKYKKVSEDYIQMYQDYGWEYCASCAHWHYFRKPQQQAQFDNDKEIFSDNKSKINMIIRIAKINVSSALLCLYSMALSFNSADISRSKILIIIFICLVSLWSYIAIKLYFKIKKLKASLAK